MPSRAPKPCAIPGCPAYAEAGHAHCTQHRATLRAGRDQGRESAWARGYDARWQRLRTLILGREPLCRACLADGRTTAAAEVDHITPLARGGTNDPANLQPLCHECHSRKTMAEVRQAARR